MALQKMSESVYVGMCHEIGTPQQVTSRRDIADMSELLRNKNELVRFMRSGSHREGFRLHDSDVDTMFWPSNHRVIWEFKYMTGVFKCITGGFKSMTEVFCCLSHNLKQS